MDANTAYAKFSYKYFASSSRKYLVPTFKDLYKDIERANITMTLVEYLSVVVATSLIVFVAISVISPIVIYQLLYIATEQQGAGSIVLSVFMGFLSGILSSCGIFMLFYTYPSVMVANRRKKIDDTLPFATLYIATISGSGTPPIAMFRALANFKEYGEISKEAERIIDETDVLGTNLTVAIENAANRTPSDRLRDILWGIKSILLVGGDLQGFLHEKADGTMQEYKRRLAQFTQQLAMYIEIYITVVIVGSVFFMVLTTIMGSLNDNPATRLFIVAAQFAITFMFLPIASLAFMVMIKSIAPSTEA